MRFLYNRHLHSAASNPGGLTISADRAGSQPAEPFLAQEQQDAARYLAMVAATIVLVGVVFAGSLWRLDAMGLRPPPAFANNFCFDTKLEYHRLNPPGNPTHLVVGSSIPWRNIDSSVIVERYPKARPLNGAFCGLTLNQSAFAARYLLKHFPTITDVLLVVSSFDLGACRSNKTNMFDPADVSDYLSGTTDFHFYLKYFDVISLVTNVFTKRTEFARFADGPLYAREHHDLVYGAAPRLQPECLAALTGLAQDLERSGKRFVVVTMPMSAEWSALYDAGSAAKDELSAALRKALAGRAVTIWDAGSNVTLPTGDYTDAVHLYRSGATSFTRRLVQATSFGSGQQ